MYRIPALDVTTRGTLIAAYDARPTLADVPGRIALVVRRSVDGGVTWLPRQVVRADTAPFGFGDPSFLVDRVTGRIFLFHVASVRQGFQGAASGNRDDDPDVLHADYSWSDDDGITWHPRRLTSAIKDSAWGGLFAASGRGIQLQRPPYAGRLVQQYVVRWNGGNYAASAYSDDHGTTWRMGQLVGPGMDENKVVELDDGTLLLNSRATPWRLVARSTDGGVSYHALHADSQLVDPANNGAIIRADERALPGSVAARRLLFVNTQHPTARTNLVVKRSCDSGAHWRTSLTLEPGLAAYATMVMLPGGDVGVLFERGDYDAITFARFTPDWPPGC